MERQDLLKTIRGIFDCKIVLFIFEGYFSNVSQSNKVNLSCELVDHCLLHGSTLQGIVDSLFFLILIDVFEQESIRDVSKLVALALGDYNKVVPLCFWLAEGLLNFSDVIKEPLSNFFLFEVFLLDVLTV